MLIPLAAVIALSAPAPLLPGAMLVDYPTKGGQSVIFDGPAVTTWICPPIRSFQ